MTTLFFARPGKHGVCVEQCKAGDVDPNLKQSDKLAKHVHYRML